VAEFQCLLESFLGIKGRQAGMLVPATGKIPQRSDVGQPGKLPWNACECAQREILNYFAILLKSCKGSHLNLLFRKRNVFNLLSLASLWPSKLSCKEGSSMKNPMKLTALLLLAAVIVLPAMRYVNYTASKSIIACGSPLPWPKPPVSSVVA
jgi:hypothetical protein